MNAPLRILHLEDNIADTELLRATLEAEGIPARLTRVETAQDFLAALRKDDVDLVLADYTLPAFDGISALMLAQRHAPHVPFIFVSGTLGEEVATEALKLGATDYVLKTRLSRLVPAVSRALREAREKTERGRAEQALRDSEEQWKAAFESNPVMYFMADRAGKILSVNAFGADQLGYNPSELVGQSLLNIFYDADREQIRKDVENCFQNLGRTFKWEARKVRKNGAIIWVRETANALLLKNQPVLLVVCEDITDRKRAEEAARRSEKELRDVFETIPAMAWSALPDGSVDFMNRAWYDYTGLSTDKAMGLKSLDIIHPDDQARTRAEWESALNNGQPIETEVRLRRADGEYRSWFVRNVPLHDEHGNIVKWYGTAIDIEDRKRAEGAVRRSEKQLRDLIETIPAMAFVTRADGSNEFVSRKWIEFSGLSAEQSAGSGWEKTLHPDDVAAHLRKWRDALASGQPVESEARHRDAHGNYRWLLVRAVPLRSEKGKILKWYGTAIDIEGRKRAEEALRASEQLARTHVEVMMRSLDVLATEAAPERLIAEMLRTIGQRLHARSVLLWLRDPQDDSLHLRLVIDDGQQVAPHQDHPFVKDPHLWKRTLPFQEMFFTKGPVVCDDLEQDSRIGAELREYMMKRGRKRFLAIPMFVLGEVRGFIGIQHSEQGAYRGEEVELAQALAHHVMIATHEAELSEQRRHAVILEERTRMARDIHDTLAQGFTGVIVQLDTAVEALRDEEPEAAATHIRRARELARESLTEARRSVHALRPLALEKADFADALKAIITNTTAGTSLKTDFQLKGKPCELEPSVEENLLHIGQEALTNALKHACATTFHTRLSFDADAVRLELRDNGKGFVTDNINGGGIGLIGMKERAEQIGATLAITSGPGAGTTITAVSAYQEPVAT